MRVISFVRLLLFVPLFFVGLATSAQKYPQNYFRYPLDSLPNLASPFGGLRPNHFHSGIDLRTNGKEGLPVYAAADGMISRIKVQRGGYGKAIYIDHPNGYTTVYGHLQQYKGPVAQWIHQYQYINESFEFDKIFLRPFLAVKKGDTIGLSGNSGGSSGPHLHYEIRNTHTENIINPGLLGLIPFDTLDPAIEQVLIYKFVTEGLLLKKKIVPNSKNCQLIDSFWVMKDTLFLDADTYGFGMETYDFIHNSRDHKDVFTYSLLQNNKLVFRHMLDNFAFSESKYINAHLDFPYYKINQTRIQKCFVDDGNEFSTYTFDKRRGRVRFEPNDNGELLFQSSDISGNTCYLKIPFQITSVQPDLDKIVYKNSILGKPAIYPGKVTHISRPGLDIKMNPKSVYDTVYYDIEINPTKKGTLSPEYAFHTSNVPIHAAFEIAIKVDYVPDYLKSKLLLAYSNSKSNYLSSAGGTYSNGWVRGTGSNFGDYSVVLDSIAPTIKKIRFKNDDDASDSLRFDFEITDNFSGIKSVTGYINGTWILLDYDPKNNQVTYRFDEVYYSESDKLKASAEGLVPSFLVLKLKVEDYRGNKNEKEFEIPLR